MIPHREHARSLTKAAAAALSVALLAAACGGSGGKGAKQGSGAATKSQGGITLASVQQPGANESSLTPKAGGSMTLAQEADTTGGWCMSEAQLAIAGIQVARSIYDTLTVPDNQGHYVPFLAQSVTPNGDFTVWTIKLRPGITFHDGSPFNAADVRDNLNNYRGSADAGDPKPLHVGTLFPFVFTYIKSVKATDNLTVTVTMNKPWSSFPAHLYQYGRLGMMAEAQMRSGKNCYRDMIGTGPFMFKGDWIPNNHLTVVKNPHYWRKDAQGRPLPYLDKLTFQTVLETASLLANLRTGTDDLAVTDNDIAISQLQNDAKANKLKILESDTDTEIGYTLLNEKTEPFNNYYARAAVAYAFNTDQYNKLRNKNLLKVANGPFAPGVLGYLPNTGFPRYNLAKAKEMVQKYTAMTHKPLKFQLGSPNDSDSVKSAQLAKSYFEAAGMQVSLHQADQSQYINDAIAGNYQAQGWRNHPGYDPDTQWIWWVCGGPAADPMPITIPKDKICDNPVNFSGFNDKVINDAFVDARSTTDEARRRADYEKVNREFTKELWEIWQYYSLWTVPAATNVHGVNNLNLPPATSANATGNPPFPGLASGIDVASLWKG